MPATSSPIPDTCTAIRTLLIEAMEAPSLATYCHLLTCADCRDFAACMRRLQNRSRVLPDLATSPALRARVLHQVDSLAVPAEYLPDTASVARRPIAPALVIGGFAATVFGMVAFLSHFRTTSTLPTEMPPTVLAPREVTQVKSAVSQAQTWYFIGWRRVRGKRVSWEVWGQRSPFLYREKVGDQVLTEDGVTRTQLLPTSPNNFRGALLTTAARNGGYPKARTVATEAKTLNNPHTWLAPLNGLGTDKTGFLADLNILGWVGLKNVSRENDSLIIKGQVYLGTHNLLQQTALQVDPRTLLPTSYIVREKRSSPSLTNTSAGSKQDHDDTHVVATLHTYYNVKLPPNITQVKAPENYTVLDTAASVPWSPALDGNGFSSGGITIRASVVGVDKAGNVHLRFTPYAGGKKLRRADLSITFSVRVSEIHGGNNPKWQSLPLHNAYSNYPASRVRDPGMEYAALQVPCYLSPEQEAMEVYAVPLEPVPVGTPLPRRVHLSIGLSGTVADWHEEEHATRQSAFFSDQVFMTLSLPSHTTTLSYPGYLYSAPKYYDQYSINNYAPTLDIAIAEQRGYKLDLLAQREASSYLSNNGFSDSVKTSNLPPLPDPDNVVFVGAEGRQAQTAGRLYDQSAYWYRKAAKLAALRQDGKKQSGLWLHQAMAEERSKRLMITNYMLRYNR